MLTSAKMIGFVLTTDYEKSKEFYVGKLGFQFVSLDQYALVVRCGENMIRIVKPANFTPLQSTVLGWEVSNIENAVAWLKQRGIAPEKYPWMKDAEIFTFPNGDKVAWFKDPDGNTLSVSHHV